MKIFISLTIIILLACCSSPDLKKQRIELVEKTAGSADTIIPVADSVFSDTSIVPKKFAKQLSVLVLPPYDMIANAGISPHIRRYLENIFTNDTSIKLIKFPSRQLMNVPYHNVFDKKFCAPITEKIKTDIIVMSKLEQVIGTGNMSTDKWNFSIKIHDTRTGGQLMSGLSGENKTGAKIEDLIKSKRRILFDEINKKN